MFQKISIAVAATTLFCAPAQAQEMRDIEPARLEAATSTIGYIFPPGTYARIMDRTMNSIMDTMMDSVGDLPMRDLARMGGLDSEELEGLGEGTLKEMLSIIDPAYDERMRVTMQVVSKEMTGLMDKFEPAFRDGLARAYAKRFTVQQLSELNAFFATPTGNAYATESMVIMTDPEVIQKMTEIMPLMMKEMPDIGKKLVDATAGLPKPRRPEDLSPAEKQRLSELLGVPVEKIGQSRYGHVNVQ